MEGRAWASTYLEDVAEELTVGHVGPMASEYVPSGIPFLRSQNIEPFRVSLADTKFITAEFHSKLAKSVLRPGDVVIVRTGKPGTAAVVPDWLPVANCADLVIVRAGPRLDPHFLCYYINGLAGHHVDAHIVGAVQQHFNVGSARRLPLRLPSLDEQHAVAYILGTLDDKIELNRRTNETLESIARALFKSWFVDFDPVRAKAEGRQPTGMDATAALFPSELVDSELGAIPKGWSALPLYDLAKYVNGAAYRVFQPNDDRRGLPIIKIAELKAGITARTKFSTVEMPQKYRLDTGDILFSWSGNPDTSIDTFVWGHGPAWLNQHIFRVEPHGEDERAFVLATLKYLRPVFAEIARNKQTTGLGHVTAGDMKRLLVVRPDQRVLAAWNERAAPIFDRVFQGALECGSLASVRDALLPRLLSGEITVTPVAKRARESCEAIG